MGNDFVRDRCGSERATEISIVDWDELGSDVYAIVHECFSCGEREVLAFRGSCARSYYRR